MALAAPNPPAQLAGGIEIHNVLKDGQLVAVLMAIGQGETFTVVTEVFSPAPDGVSKHTVRRPYTFTQADEGLAFFTEAVTAFTYLGCEVRKQ